MVTGSRGVHVVCPLRRGAGFSDVHGFARALAEEMVADDPRRLTLEWKKVDRGEKIYVDVNRNAYAQHAVAPYGVRPRDRAPVAVPRAVGGALGAQAATRPLDDPQPRRPPGGGRRPVAGDGPARAQAAGPRLIVPPGQPAAADHHSARSTRRHSSGPGGGSARYCG